MAFRRAACTRWATWQRRFHVPLVSNDPSESAKLRKNRREGASKRTPIRCVRACWRPAQAHLTPDIVGLELCSGQSELACEAFETATQPLKTIRNATVTGYQTCSAG